MLTRTRMKAVLVTRGSRGMALFEPRRQTVHIPIHGSDQIADVTGAGDTVIATMSMALASGASTIEAAHLANIAAGLVVISAVTAVASVFAALIPPSEEGGIADLGKWSDLGVTFVKAVYGLAPYIALGSLLAVLTQSSAVSISTSLVYYVVELIATPLLGLNETLEKLTDFILGSNVNNWMESAFVTVEINESGGLAEQPDALHAFLVILVYTVVLAAAAFWIFQRRDIAGARGD